MKRRIRNLYSRLAGPLPWTITVRIGVLCLLFCLISALQFYLFYDHILNELAQLLAFQLLPHELAEISRQLPNLHWALAVWTVPLLLVNTLFAGLAALWLSRRIAGPTLAIRSHLQRVGNGDLQAQLSLRQDDELKEVADEINQAVSKLQVMVWGIKTNLEALEAASEAAGEADRQRLQQQLQAIRINLNWFETLEQKNSDEVDSAVP
ncbi:HAMP domain-containing protein [Ferrimonas sp. SCSIO 43195]|uniref:HAMP domain-containing protein n=1 Tax=Ferrimonas sp. SCSIO 43195 TaxID=2822844 RepID=UPI002074E360|nr:methyl-accepting chemotaxis protein [Ferrimonas sp. SCSIO 43195]USD38074.1 methyl-accepting chemotaxis protein [Ferrimonas sp. SCSIO 43195]